MKITISCRIKLNHVLHGNISWLGLCLLSLLALIDEWFVCVCVCACKVTHGSTVHCLSQTKAGCISAGLDDEPKTRREDTKITAYTLSYKLKQHKRWQITDHVFTYLLVDVSRIVSCLMAHTLWFFRPFFVCMCVCACPLVCSVWSAHKQTREEYCGIYSVWSEGYRGHILCRTK